MKGHYWDNLWPKIIDFILQKNSDVTSKLVSKKQNISHRRSAVSSLIRFAKSTWSMTSKASFTWKPRDFFSIWFRRSEPQRRFLYIITHYNALALFLFILIYILLSNELCPLNNSLKTLTDHRFNSWVYVWFIWFILLAVHQHKWMTLTMAIIFIQ